jgi:CBS domain-containing protein
MTAKVRTIAATTPLQDAARMLSREQISGAPVVDGDGRCIGVLSATDFMHWAERKENEPVRSTTSACVCSDWQVVEWELLPRDEVRWYMTPDAVTVTPGTPIQELARTMLDAHIHRVLVVDSGRHPVGIVTSTDVLAALAYAGTPLACSPAAGRKPRSIEEVVAER